MYTVLRRRRYQQHEKLFCKHTEISTAPPLLTSATFFWYIFFTSHGKYIILLISLFSFIKKRIFIFHPFAIQHYIIRQHNIRHLDIILC
jgi:hypothetical protein